MDYHSNEAGKHVFNFHGPEEIGTVAAVFREYVENLALKGNESSIDPYHESIAAWDEDTTTRQYRTFRPENFLDMLRAYTTDTELVVDGFMEDNGHANDARIEKTAQRYKHGYYAGVLAIDVAAALEAATVPNEDID